MTTMIYDKQKTIFYGIDKCASTRMYNYFGRSRNNSSGEKIFYPASKEYPLTTPVSKIRKSYPDYFIFTFIRNPYDRIISHYCGSRFSNKEATEEYITFDVYARSRAYCSMVPMTQHLNTDKIDFIGRYERLKEDFDKLHKLLDIEIQWQADGSHPLEQKDNESFNRFKLPYRDFYGSDTKDVIEKRYKIDLEKFGYEF